ncbi:MAG TPA: hypothetical protein VKZ75_00995 [Cyclobacteriaceae bacterium]|nr:hypothetical protein [Cyclobacteriaceae bacterium]
MEKQTARGNSNKPKVQARGKKAKRDKEAMREDQNEPTGPFDFGGLPARDLKKNLGCG